MGKKGWIYLLLPLAFFVIGAILTSLRFYFLKAALTNPTADISCRFVIQDTTGDEAFYQVILNNAGKSSLSHLRVVVADDHKKLLQGWFIPKMDKNETLVLNGKTKEFAESFHIAVYQGNRVIKTLVEKVSDTSEDHTQASFLKFK